MVELVQPSGSGSGTALTVTDGITTVTNVSTIDFSGATVMNGGGGTADVIITTSGFTKLTATGTVNGVNKSFTFIQEPSYIIADGAWYEKLDANGNINWSWAINTATMTIPPNSFIFGIA